MLYVIADRCSKDTSCIQACPVDAIHPTPRDPGFDTAEQLYIDPAACIACGACAVACPLDTIYADHELPERLADYVALNAEQFVGADHVDPEDVGEPARATTTWGATLPRVAIVGSGPSALYTACALIERGIEVSIFEKLPTPFGLIRSGVAPDHQQTRDVGALFQPALDSPLVHWYLGIEVGTDIDSDELLRYHHAVIWATGAAVNRPLEIPGENLPGSYSARDFVSWYNGHPDFADQTFDLSATRALIIGNGNVALDVARLLTAPLDALTQTAIPRAVLDRLGASDVRSAVIVGRRGPVEAAFTTSELLALHGSQELQLQVSHDDLSRVRTTHSEKPSTKLRLIRSAPDTAESTRDRTIELRFLLTPLAINGDDRVKSVEFMRNLLVTRDGESSILPTGQTEVIKAGLVFAATGARGEAIAGIPFDSNSGRMPNIDGSLINPATGARLPGQYCVGWIKRGATGVLGTNRQDATTAADTFAEDFHAGRLLEPSQVRADLEVRIARAVHPLDINDWHRIDQAEIAEGARTGRARATLHTIDALHHAAAQRDPTL